MDVEASPTYRDIARNQYPTESLGSGHPGPSCGVMRNWGHAAGPMMHGETVIYRCKRADCPECFDKRHGYLDQAVDRIEAGLAKSYNPNQRVAYTISHFILTPECTEDLFFDPAYRRGFLQRFRAHYGPDVGTPGAWVAHYNASSCDECPVAPHLHVWVPSARPIADLQERVDATLTCRSIPRNSIPELRACVLGMGRVSLPSSSGMKRRFAATIGWFGRRVVSKALKDWEDAPEKVRHCKICGQDVPRAQWNRVIPKRFRPEKEGPWEVPVGEVDVIDPLDWRQLA